MDERARRIERRFEAPIVAAAILMIPVIVIEHSNPGEPWQTSPVGNWII
jgi:hypothetical protein